MLSLDLDERGLWPLFKSKMIPHVLLQIEPSDSPNLVRSTLRGIGLSKVKSWRLASTLAKAGLEDFRMDGTVFHLNYYDHRIENILRSRSIRKIFRLLAEDEGQRLREIARALRTGVAVVARAIRLLSSAAAVVEKRGGQFRIRDGLVYRPPNRAELIPQRQYAKTFEVLTNRIEKSIGQQYLHAFILSGPHGNGTAMSHDRATLTAIVKSTEPEHVKFVIDNLRTAVDSVADRMDVGPIAICVRDAWLRQLLFIRKRRSPLLEQGFDGVPLLGKKPRRNDLFDALFEETPATPETIEDWKRSGYLIDTDGKLQFTLRGFHFLKVRAPLYIREKEERVNIRGRTFHLIYD
jgi:hypothetical protein